MWSDRALCFSCAFCCEFTDSEIWTAIQKTSQLTLTPNSASKRRIQRLSKSSLSSECPPTPITLNVPVKFIEIKVLLHQILALLQPVVLYHLLCLSASSCGCEQEKRGGGVSVQSAQPIGPCTQEEQGQRQVWDSSSPNLLIILYFIVDRISMRRAAWEELTDDRAWSGGCTCTHSHSPTIQKNTIQMLSYFNKCLENWEIKTRKVNKMNNSYRIVKRRKKSKV